MKRTSRTRNLALNLSLTPMALATRSLLIPAIAFAGMASAQQTTATVVGNVTDPTGSIIPGATVTIINSGTNATRSTKTDADGKYAIPYLVAGTYILRVEMPGFAKQELQGIVLDASQTDRHDFALTIGEVKDTITVQSSAAAAQLQTENGAVGEVIDAKKIVDLPLNGRNFIQLAQLIPGANSGTEGSITVRRARGALASSDATGGSTAVQVNGQRDTQNRYSIDGIEDMDYDAFTYSFSPSVDAIAEFRVDTANSGTDTGAAAGANVNLIIKSGTNRPHGTLFYFNRNNAFTQYYDAIANKDYTAPRLNRNQFGGNIGGPVFIPKLYDGRNKTFFFFNVESGTLLSAAPAQFTNVPSVAVRSGNIDELINAASTSAGCKAGTASCFLVNPYTQTPYTLGQKIAVDSKATILLNNTPVPNATGASNYQTPLLKTLNYQHDYILRIDHTISKKDSIYGHYIHDVTYSNGAPFFGNDNDNNRALTTHYMASETHVFSPRLVNEFRYGRQIFKEFETFPATGNAALNIANGQMNIPFSSSDPMFYGPPNTTISNVGTAYRLFADLRNIGPRNRANGINQYSDSLSYQVGKHFIKFGADLGRRTDFFTQARDPRGTFSFDGRYTGGFATVGTTTFAQGAAGAGLLDFLLGYVATDSINPTVTQTHIVSLIQGYSVQDNYTAKSNLTFNLGVRWDHFPPWYQQDNRFADIFAGPDQVTPGSIVTPANSPNGRGLVKSNYYDFAPRLGFAWQPFGEKAAVIRGGYGIYFVPDIANGYFQEAEGAQAQAGASLTGNTGAVSGGTAALPNLTLANPFPGVATGGPSTYPFAVEIYQNLAEQMSQQFNLTVQTPLAYKFTGEIGYVGTRGTHNYAYYPDVNLPRPVNPATPGLASVNARRPNQTFARTVQGELSNGSSSYHSLQAKLERRVSSGLNVLAAYTFSRSISGPADVGGLVGGGNFGATALDPLNVQADRSLSIFDIPHRFVGTVLYDIPFFKHTTGFKRALLDGFQVSTILTAVSGDPSAAFYTGPTVNASSQNARPDVVVGQVANLSRGQRTPMRQFNTAAFTTPAVATFGNSRRTGALRLPGVFNDDISVTKGIKFRETGNLQLRADFFNAFKHYNPDPSTITTTINSTNYGRINDGTQGGYAIRVIQLGAKLYF
jgi:hypothetical protein